MPDSPADSSSPPRTPTSGTEQHPAGCRVDPAPDGRGRPPQQKPPMIPRSRAFIAFLLGLLAVNILISRPHQRARRAGPRVPYQPFFVNQVTANNVEEISSTGESIEGTLKNEATYDPPGDDKPVKVDKDFKTEVPSFIDPARSRRCSSSTAS